MAAAESKRAAFYGIGACLLAALLVGLLAWNRWLAPMDNLVYDYLLRLRAKGPAAAARSGIMLVTVDEESMADVNQRWPWPRSLFGRLIDKLNAAGVKAIGLDVLFPESSENADDDQTMAAALARAGNVVLAAKIEAVDRTFAEAGLAVTGNRLVLPLPEFRIAARPGVVNLDLDSGAIVRTCRNSFLHQNVNWDSFAAAVFQTAFNQPFQLPPGTRQYIDYLGPTGTFPAVPAAQILNDAISLAPFRDKIALIGVTFMDAHDLHAIPIGRQNLLCSGVEVQANILAGMIRQSSCTLMPRLPRTAAAVLLALLSGYLILFRSARLLAGIFALIVVAVLTGAAWMMISRGYFMDVSYLLLAMPLTFILAGMTLRKPLVLETKVGPYRLLEELGRGGMAVVYRARHPRTGEIVALKQLLPQFAADQLQLQRFLSEIELIRRLEHPNLIHIIDAGEVNGQPYYAMEYIEGLTLEKIQQREHRLPPADVRRIGGAVARALARAHEAGVIHRDIKPGNIMLTGSGTPKLMDFGIARGLDAPQLTQTGLVIGTPLYLAPELCRGDNATPASDIYSLGATLYALLAGRPPFSHEDQRALVTQIITRPPPELADYCPVGDPELMALIMSCLNKNPQDRPPDMLTVARCLDPFFTEMAIHPQTGQATRSLLEVLELTEKGTVYMSLHQIPTVAELPAAEDPPREQNSADHRT